MLEVREVAQRAGVSEAAVRARLASGALAGERVRVGAREVWRVDPVAAQAYITEHAGKPRPDAPGAATAAAAKPATAPGAVPGGDDTGAGAPAARPAQRARAGAASQAQLAELLEQNAELTRALVTLARAHESLVAALTAQGSAADPVR
jgi:hypothetical protein